MKIMLVLLLTLLSIADGHVTDVHGDPEEHMNAVSAI